MAALIFVTGTDTGVGKTVVTGLLLQHLRQQGINALAVKPFSAGSDEDARFLGGLQAGRLDLQETSPYRFTKPLAPGVQNYPGGKAPNLEDAVRFVGETGRKCEILLVEGCGGLMVPLGRDFMVLDLIVALKCPVLLVAANRLGAINHVLLSVKVLESFGCEEIRVVLNEISGGESELKRGNETFLRSAVAPRTLISLGYIGKGRFFPGGAKICAKKIKITLARMTGFDSLLGLFGTHEAKNGEPKKKTVDSRSKTDKVVLH